MTESQNAQNPKRWKITVEYDGTDYCGFQKQDNVPTIQVAIETALTKFCQKTIPITVAGRTDAGVHARGQIAHFDLDYGERPLSGLELCKALNAHLRPQPISIIDAEIVSNDFHARFGAEQKLYQYQVFNRAHEPTLERNFSWWRKRPLDIDAMIEASKILIGTHDFTSFRDSECQAKSPIRTVDKIDINHKEIIGGNIITFDVEGQSFLHHMVRNIVGTLSLVGEGKWGIQNVQDALDARDRTKGGPTAPAAGLTLMKIDYSDD